MPPPPGRSAVPAWDVSLPGCLGSLPAPRLAESRGCRESGRLGPRPSRGVQAVGCREPGSSPPSLPPTPHLPCQARDTQTGELAAIKIVKLDPGDDTSSIEQEVTALRECGHPNVVAYFGSYLRCGGLRGGRYPSSNPPRASGLCCTFLLTPLPQSQPHPSSGPHVCSPQKCPAGVEWICMEYCGGGSLQEIYHGECWVPSGPGGGGREPEAWVPSGSGICPGALPSPRMGPGRLGVL
ncbi:uncharacterized protein LOC106722741 [Alligator sinensis]|uniref:Uncharacterized protein LOC106722741 n=1 Tax=Alligator sinensis TaxID=38654 RepID=A0A3Q0HJK8_ALLSI|nr:uncharacterized protein LOC106722741 [Alligator sinensis]